MQFTVRKKNSLKVVLTEVFPLSSLKAVVKRRRLKQARRFYASRPQGLFTNILLETVNQCNNTCAFCPRNVRDNPDEKLFMSMELFEKIISELEALDFSGVVHMYCNNEPLLDERLPGMIQMVTERLPAAVSMVLTNGILLRKQKAEALFDAGLGILKCNSYADGKHLTPMLSKLVEEGGDAHPEKNVLITLRNQQEVLSSLGGLAPNKPMESPSANTYSDHFCDKPFRQMVVHPSGTVALCCVDVFGGYPVGNVSTHSLEEIWFESKPLNYARKRLLNSDRSFTELCSLCDFYGYSFMPEPGYLKE